MSDRSQETITLLGRSESRLPASPDAATLETFTNRNPQRNYTISLDYPEFSSLCPVTGQPDSFNEDIVNRILDDLVAATAPRRASVRGEFSPRGGIRLTAEAHFPDVAL